MEPVTISLDVASMTEWLGSNLSTFASIAYFIGFAYTFIRSSRQLFREATVEKMANMQKYSPLAGFGIASIWPAISACQALNWAGGLVVRDLRRTVNSSPEVVNTTSPVASSTGTIMPARVVFVKNNPESIGRVVAVKGDVATVNINGHTTSFYVRDLELIK